MPTVAVTRHESALGSLTHAQWKPAFSSQLAGSIDQIWYFDGTLGEVRERVFPDGTLELIVQLDSPHRPGVDGPARPFPPVCVTGLRTTAEVVEAPPGRCRVLGVRLTPPAAFRLLCAPLPELTARTADLHAVIGRGAAELEALQRRVSRACRPDTGYVSARDAVSRNDEPRRRRGAIFPRHGGVTSGRLTV
jgi:hypothetical protein